MWWIILELIIFIGIYLCIIYDDISDYINKRRDRRMWKRIMGREYYS